MSLKIFRMQSTTFLKDAVPIDTLLWYLSHIFGTATSVFGICAHIFRICRTVSPHTKVVFGRTSEIEKPFKIMRNVWWKLWDGLLLNISSVDAHPAEVIWGDFSIPLFGKSSTILSDKYQFQKNPWLASQLIYIIDFFLYKEIRISGGNIIHESNK